MKTEEFDKVHNFLQKAYDKNFSFLNFDEFRFFSLHTSFISYCNISTHAAFDLHKMSAIIESKGTVKAIMKAHLIDALLSARNLIDEDLKRLGFTTIKPFC